MRKHDGVFRGFEGREMTIHDDVPPYDVVPANRWPTMLHW